MTTPPIGEAGLVMDVGGVSGLLRGAGNLQDALVEISLFDRRDTIRRGAVPAFADGFGEISVLLTLERVVKKESALLQPGGIPAVCSASGAGDQCNESDEAKGEFHENEGRARERCLSRSG